MDRAPAAGAIEDAGLALTDAGRAAPDAAVPSCPGWTVATVVKHIGLVHAWAGEVLRTYPTEAPPFPKAGANHARTRSPQSASPMRTVIGR